MKDNNNSKFLFYFTLPIFFLPLIHIPLGFKTLKAIEIKMFSLFAVAFILISYHMIKVLIAQKRTLSHREATMEKEGKLLVLKKKIVGKDAVLFLPIIIFFLNLISYFNSPMGKHSLLSLLTLLGFMIIFFSTYNFSFKQSCLIKSGHIIISIGTVSAFYSIFQQIGYDPIGLKTWDGISATFPNRNFLGGYLAFSLLFTIGYIIRDNKKNGFLIFTAIILGDGLILSETRAAWGAFVCGIFFFLLFDILFFYKGRAHWMKCYRGKIPALLLTIILVSITTPWINSNKREPMSIQERMAFVEDIKEMIIKTDSSPLEETKSFSVKMRYLYWRMAVDMIKEAPAFGLGIGYFRTGYYPYLIKYLVLENYKNAHTWPPIGVDNDYLEFWVDAGIMNLLAYLTLILYTFLSGYRILLRKRDLLSQTGLNDYSLFLLLLSGVVVISSHGLFHYSLHDPIMGSFFWGSLGIIHKFIKHPLYSIPSIRLIHKNIP